MQHQIPIYGMIPTRSCYLMSFLYRCLFKPSNYLWIFFMYGWAITVYILNLIIWGACHYYMKKIAPSATHKQTLRLLVGKCYPAPFHIIISFTGYSISFWLAWSFPIVRRSWEAWGPDDPHVMNVLRFGHAVTVPLQG